MIAIRMYYVLLLHLIHTPIVQNALICPKGITSFSNGPYSVNYYSCDKENQLAVLKSCSSKEYYLPSKKTCTKLLNETYPMDNPDIKIYNRPALGEKTFLGDFFNSNTAKVLTGYSLWKSATIKKNKLKTSSPTSFVDVYSTRSMLDRLDRAGYSSGVKLDVLGDVVNVEGSSKYFKDHLSSDMEVAVVLTFSATTTSDILPISTPSDFDYCGRNMATHVISTVTHGLSANFVFRKSIGESESKEEVEQMLLYAVRAIPKLQPVVPDDIKKIVDNVWVDFYADFVSEEQPTTYAASVRMYHSLSYHLKNVNSTVAMSMQLMPLSHFCPGKLIHHTDIADDLLDSANNMIAELESSELRIKTLQVMESARKYAPLKNMLHTLFRALKIYQFRMKKDLREVLLDIHHGNSSEGELVALLNKYTDSPFNKENVDKFLRNRHRELKMLKFIIDPRKISRTDIKVCSYEEAIDIETMFLKPYTLMLRFNVLPSKHLIQSFLSGNAIDEESAWYNNPLVISAMGRAFMKFTDFAAYNTNSEKHGFLLGIANAKKSVAFDILSDIINVLAQKEGLFYYNFEFPFIPQVMKGVSSTHESVSFEVIRPQNNWVTSFSVTFWVEGKMNQSTTKHLKFSSSNITTFEVKGLVANTLYGWVMQYSTPMGSSPQSLMSLLNTRLCSPPSEITVADLGSSSVRIQWKPPLVCGKGVTAKKYRVRVNGTNDDLREIIVDNATEVRVENLKAGSKYSAAVTAIKDRYLTPQITYNTLISTLASNIEFFTRPDAPSYLSLMDIQTHCATIQWFAPKHVAPGSVIEKYIVKYTISNDLGDVTVKETEMTMISYNSSCRLTDLIQGTTYAIRVKALTSKGESDFTSNLFVKTLFTKSDLALLNESLSLKINKSFSQIQSQMEHQRAEIDNHLNKNEFFIQSLNSTKPMMVYYPRLPSEGIVIDRATGCGGTVNSGGNKDGFSLSYPAWNTQKYAYFSGCTWNVKTGLPTTISVYDWDVDCPYSFVSIHDENTLIKKTCSKFSPIKLLSGNGVVQFMSSGSYEKTGFRLVIQVTETKRMAAHRYYLDSRASFTGYGQPKRYSEHHTINLPKSNSSIPTCIHDCRRRFVQDIEWSVVAMELETDPIQCTCYKQADGFQYVLTKFQYKFL